MHSEANSSYSYVRLALPILVCMQQLPPAAKRQRVAAPPSCSKDGSKETEVRRLTRAMSTPQDVTMASKGGPSRVLGLGAAADGSPARMISPAAAGGGNGNGGGIRNSDGSMKRSRQQQHQERQQQHQALLVDPEVIIISSDDDDDDDVPARDRGTRRAPATRQVSHRECDSVVVHCAFCATTCKITLQCLYWV